MLGWPQSAVGVQTSQFPCTVACGRYSQVPYDAAYKVCRPLFLETAPRVFRNRQNQKPVDLRGRCGMSAVPKRLLGNTGLEVSVLGFGASPLGSVFEVKGGTAVLLGSIGQFCLGSSMHA